MRKVVEQAGVVGSQASSDRVTVLEAGASVPAAARSTATRAMARAQATGEVTTSAAPEAQARLLLLLFQGAALASRAQPDRDSLAASIDAALDALRAAATTAPRC